LICCHGKAEKEINMTHAEQLADFVVSASYEKLSEQARAALKIRILDALGCALGALGGDVPRLIRQQVDEFGGNQLCSLIGGGQTSPDRAALYNSALVRYLDFNDSYLAKGETCHPSDNLGAVLAAAEYARSSGAALLTALAVAYQVQCRLSDVAPVRAKGFDHTTQGSYAVAAGVSKALNLGRLETAHALAISGTAFNALRVTRTGALSHWKGLAYPNTACGALQAAFLAKRGITGPLEVFEGNKGFMDAIAGRFAIAWEREDLESVGRTIVKKYNAEIHSQSALEGLLELQKEAGFKAAEVESVAVEIFDVAFNIIGGGEEGGKHLVRTKEEADHSLPYLLAVACLDGTIMPEQYEKERIQSADVQALLKRIQIHPSPVFSQRFPEEMPCRIEVTLQDGRRLVKEKRDYEGFRTHPTSWETSVKKFDRLSLGHTDAGTRGQIVEAVSALEKVPAAKLLRLLAGAATKKPRRRGVGHEITK
jgi:2-methylcitrate dehydratase